MYSQTPALLCFSLLNVSRPQTGNTQLPSLLIIPTVVLESFSPYSLSSLSVISASWISTKFDTPPEDTSFPAQKGCKLLPGYTAKNLRSSPVSHLCTNASSHLRQKFLTTKLWHPAILTFTILYGHDAVNVPDFPVFGTRLPDSSLPHVPPSFWMTSVILRKTHPTPSPRLLTAFTPTQFELFLPQLPSRLFHNPERPL